MEYRNNHKWAFMVIEDKLNQYISDVENSDLMAEFICINSDIDDNFKEKFNYNFDYIVNNKEKENIVIHLTSKGGDPNIIFELVPRIRESFKKVFFIIPIEAMSTASLFALSGNKIFIVPFAKMGDLRLQINYGKYHYPFNAIIENEFGNLEKCPTLSPEEKSLLTNIKSKFEFQSSNNFIKIIKNTCSQYLSNYMFKNVKLSKEEKDKISLIPHKLTDPIELIKLNCITHSTGLYYRILKELGINIENYLETKPTWMKSIIEFNSLIIDYRNLNSDESCFIYSKHSKDILNDKS